MTDLLSEVEYGRILGSFTAVAEDFGDTVAPDAIPLTGTVLFTPSVSHVSYVNSAGETASLYVSPVSASITSGRLVGSDGKDGVTLLASNSNNVSASVLWNASISINPLGPDQEAPETYNFLIEVRRNEISSLIDVIKANSRVHNVALFHDAIAEAAAKFWERVEAGEFRGNQGPPGPAGVGVGVPGPEGRPGIIGKDGDPGVGGNLLPDGDLEEPGFLVTGDYQETSDAASGSKAVKLTNATSRKIRLEPETSYVGTVYLKSPEASTATITMRVFGNEGDISRVIENSYNLPADTWRRVTFLLDSNLGDQSMEIITASDGRTISADLYTLSDNSVVQGLQRDLSAAQAQLEAAMAQLDLDLAEVEANRVILGESLKDLAVVLEDADVDLTELNQQMADLKSDLAAEETKRQEADEAAQVILEQLDTNLSQAKQELVDNKIILETLDTDLATAKAELLESAQSIETLETVTLPELRSTLEAANEAAIQELNALDDKLYGAEGDITTAKESIAQLAADLTTEAQTREQLARDLQADFEERDTRLAEAEDILSAAFPDGAVNVPEELSRTIRDSVVQYAVSDSAETPPTTGWSAAAPNKDPGQYIWFRTLITYADNSTSPSSAALLTGNTGPSGPQGPSGEDGKDGTGVTILGSRDSEAQLPTTGNDGDAYLVGGYLYVWSSGSWSNVGLIRGPQGVPGPAGADGEPRYTWVKYASSASGADISDDPAGKSYIGLAYNKPTAVESDIPGDYQWALIQGPQGSPGIQGPAGKDGTSLYTWLKYASTPTTGMSDSPVGKDYIGLAYNKTTPTESDNYTDYQWTLIKGEKGDQGVPGAPGEDGTPRYTWVKYATSASGADMSDDPTGKTYIGLAYNKTTQTESSVASDYQWALIQGPKGDPGPQGIPGPDGADGESLYTWIKYADTPTSGMADLPAGKKYMGIAYNKPTATESSSYSDYEWSLIEGPQGNQGIQGPKGDDGQTTYTWIKYGTSATGAGMSDSPTGKTYIGIAYNKTTATESNTASDYQWSLIQGPRGATGSTGPQGIGISRITPYYRDVVRGAAAPDEPTSATPSGWDTSEPTWVPNRDLYRVEKITYTNNTFAYTAVTKIAAYAGIDAAMAAANGKNLNTYTDLAPASKPGPAPAPDSTRTSGDIHRNRNSSTGEIWAEYQWTGSAWKEVSYGDEILRSLDVGKVTGGTGAFQQFFADKLIADDATITKLWTDQLVGKTAAFTKLTIAPGNLFPDPYFQEPEQWVGSGVSIEDDPNMPNGRRMTLTSSTSQSGAYYGTSGYRGVMLEPGASYRVRALIRFGGNAPLEDRITLYSRMTKPDGSTTLVGTPINRTVVGEYAWHESTLNVPDTVQGPATFGFFTTGPYDKKGITYIGGVEVVRKAGAVLIEDGAVSADKINAESVGAAVGKFIELETSQLVATDSIKTPEAVIDKIWADGISAKAISASSITVSTGNLIPDPNIRDPELTAHRQAESTTGWRPDAINGSYWLFTDPTGVPTLHLHGLGNRYATTDIIPGQEYVYTFEARKDNSLTASARMAASYTREDGSTGYSGMGGYIELPTTSAWTQISGKWVAPSDASSGSFSIQVTDTSGSGLVRIKNPSVRPSTGAILIQDGAVNASKINAESVGAAVGEFVKLDVKNLTSSTANINSLVAQKIAAGTAAFQTVNADKIIASTGTMDSATINQIWADGIAAKAITAASITVGSSNAYPDPDLQESSGWHSGRYNSTGGRNGGGSILIESGTAQRGSYYNLSGSPAGVPIKPGKYKMGAWMRPSLSYTGRGPTMYARLYRDDGTWSFAGTGGTNYYGDGTANVWQYEEWELVVPDDGYTRLVIGFYINNPYQGAARFSDPTLRPMVGAVLIENGAISANHMTANSIDTEHLRANAVDAEKIRAGAVTTDKMVANTIDGDRIRANTLHAGKILANTITASKIASKTISAEEIKARTILAENIVASTITANEIKARTITAAEIRAGTITANELNVGNITADSGFIKDFWANTITAQKITSEHINADSIWTNALAAKAITTTRMVISPENMIPGMGDVANGRRPDPDPFRMFTVHSTGYMYTQGAITGNIEAPIPVQAGKKYKLTFDVNASVANTRYYIQIMGANPDGTTGGVNPGLEGTTSTYLASNILVTTANTWHPQEFEWTPGSTGYAFLRFYTNHSNGASTSTTVQRFRRFSLTPMTGADLIVDGSVSAKHINTTSIGAELVTAGAIKSASSGERFELDKTGLILYGADAEEGERVRLGPSGENLLTIGNSTISQDNVSSVSGSYENLTVDGQDLTEIIDSLPRGMRAWGQLTSNSKFDSDTSRFARRGELQTTLLPDRLYRVRLSNHFLDVDGGQNATAREELRYSLDQTNITTGLSPDSGRKEYVGTWMRQHVFSGDTRAASSLEFLLDTEGWTGERHFWVMYLIAPEQSGRAVRVVASTSYPAILSVEDMGPSQPGLIKRWNDGSGTGSQDPAPTIKRYTTTWGAGGYGGDTGSGEVIQGQYGSYGNRSGSWKFSSSMQSALSGSTIEKFEVYLYASHWYYGAGGTASIRPTTGGYKSFTGSAFTSGNWPRHAGRWVKVPKSWHSAIANGTYKGIGVQTGSSSLSYYGRFKGTSTKFRVTYRK